MLVDDFGEIIYVGDAQFELGLLTAVVRQRRSSNVALGNALGTLKNQNRYLDYPQA